MMRPVLLVPLGQPEGPLLENGKRSGAFEVSKDYILICWQQRPLAVAGVITYLIEDICFAMHGNL
jgi:hypothetical protein